MMTPPIRRSWLFSRAAGRLYFVSAILGLALLISFIAIAFTQALVGPLQETTAIHAALLLLLFPGACGISVVWVAMWLCLLNFEKETFSGAVYGPLFLLLGPIGTLIYHFARYRRLLRTSQSVAVASASA
jgi:hypothetical protein